MKCASCGTNDHFDPIIGDSTPRSRKTALIQKNGLASGSNVSAEAR